MGLVRVWGTLADRLRFGWESQPAGQPVVRAFIGAFADTIDVDRTGTRVFMQCFAYNPASAPLTGSQVGGIKLEFNDVSTSVPPAPEENLAFPDSNTPKTRG